MKSFSSASFANDASQTLTWAQEAIRKHPQALFTNFQWFLYAACDTVFYTAFSREVFDKDALGNVVAEMVALAPQLTHGFVGAVLNEPFPKHLLDAVTTVTEVDDFDGYPDTWISRSQDIFATPDLPLFRVSVANRRGGPDALGRASAIQVRSSHALLEGSDSALLTRSQSAAHGIMSDKGKKVSWASRIAGTARALSMTLSYLVLANIFAATERPWGFKTLAIKRHRLRVLSRRLGVRTRSLMFALVMHGLNGEDGKHFSAKAIKSAYTLLEGERHEADDDFFRVRALLTNFPWKDNFIAFVKAVDAEIDKIERKDITKFQVMMMAMFATLRGLNRALPFLPGKRFWRFNGGIHVTLTLVPPHRSYGPMQHGVLEPIFCGAWHPATNICTFCPGREYVTLNFSMEARHIVNVDRIATLLDRVEAMLPKGDEPVLVGDDEE